MADEPRRPALTRTSGAIAWPEQRPRFPKRDHPMRSSSSVSYEEHLYGDTLWIAIRTRGAEWSWLTPQEAADLGRQWVEKYDSISAKRTLAFAMITKPAANG
jgi:hypothetical protein